MRLLLFGASAALLVYLFRRSRPRVNVADDVLITRVRFALDKLMEHGGAVDIRVERGVVTLSGPAAAPEVRSAVRAIRNVPGVRKVVSRLRPHAAAA